MGGQPEIFFPLALTTPTPLSCSEGDVPASPRRLGKRETDAAFTVALMPSGLLF